MLRVLFALFIGAMIAAGIMYLLALVYGDMPTGPAEIGSLDTKPPIDEAEHTARLEFVRSQHCETELSDFAQLIEESRSCQTDSDCRLAHFGCPFGCLSAVASNRFDFLHKVHRRVRVCSNCVYSCRSPVFEWRAVCVENVCEVSDGSILEFERETLEHISD